ncbi:endo-1,4-beta-xylanase [Lewinella aquimaris]|uniref:Beta-xylanase n=1 Tax=Neolewinella aquimaris TaxID=1835722 RepID=A0A840E401_9BACT|nr:endo-1,4-beta-xylanase [Neolewinella aquimaris]MBB4078683.1 endo-1,4-beta-xylanase [Neolewinella aquimaris]
MARLLLIVFLGWLVGCGDAPPANEQTDASRKAVTGLKDVAPFPIGGAVSIRKLAGDTALRAIVTTEFSSLTSTNDMKMYSIAAREGQLDFARADSTVAFAEANGMRMFGHALVWHYGLPEYITSKDRAGMEAFLTEYIDTVVTHFRGRVDGWDVVNEVFDTRGGELRATPFYTAMGEDYIELAFRTAHAADPQAKLFINDFGTERDTSKLNALVDLVVRMRQTGVPIHGIGFQWHQQMRDDTAVIRQTLRRAAATGLLLHISELDLIFNTHNDAAGGGVEEISRMTPELLAAQADRYETLARIYRQEVPAPQRYGITFWDFTDRDTWIRGFFDMNDWPTLYDDDLQPKPAYDGFRRGLEER